MVACLECLLSFTVSVRGLWVFGSLGMGVEGNRSEGSGVALQCRVGTFSERFLSWRRRLYPAETEGFYFMHFKFRYGFWKILLSKGIEMVERNAIYALCYGILFKDPNCSLSLAGTSISAPAILSGKACLSRSSPWSLV